METKVMPTDLQKEMYKDYMHFYDIADNVIEIAKEFSDVSLDIVDDVEVLVDTIEKNSETLIDGLMDYTQSGKPLAGMNKLKMEKAVKEINENFEKFLKVVKGEK